MRSLTINSCRVLVILSALALVAAPAAAAANGGTITGKVVVDGAAPAASTIEISVDPDVCGASQDSQEFVVGADGGVRWAVVELIGAPGERPAPAETPVFDQNGCTFKPHVVVVGTEAPLNVLNNDGILHNVHSYSETNPPMNVAQPGFRKSMEVTFAEPEIVNVRCDVHAWMSGWIYVTDSPYVAVTEADGSFTLTGVPAGTYELKVWHEGAGEQTQQITITDGGSAEATFTLEPAAS